jgi:AcrR family transcriptional regulator
VLHVDKVTDRQQRRKQRTRAAIEQAALELFAAHGYRATTIAAIADAADVALRTVTVHFPTKEALLFSEDPFGAPALKARIGGRSAGESTLDAVRDWMARTMRDLGEGTAAPQNEFWRRRALRARVIAADDDLRARARAGYHRYEQLIAAGIGEDLGEPAGALVCRLAAATVVVGLRELYEAHEVQASEVPPSTTDLLDLVDRVLNFVRAGIEAMRRPGFADDGSV